MDPVAAVDGFGVIAVRPAADGVADVDGVEAFDGAEVAGVNGVDGLAFEAVELEEAVDPDGALVALAVDDGDVLACGDGAGVDASDGDAADVPAVVEGGDEDLEGGHPPLAPPSREGA